MKKAFFVGFLFLLSSIRMISAMAAQEGSKSGGGSSNFLMILLFLMIIGFIVLWPNALLRVLKSYPDANKGFDAAAWAITLLFLLPPIGVILSFTTIKDNNSNEIIMPNKTARILSKIGLFLVAIGYFMPLTLNASVFGILDDLSRMVSLLGIDISSYKFLVYLTFVSSVVGIILLCLLFAGKTMGLIFDWAVVAVANGSILILLIRLNNLVKEVASSFGGGYFSLKDLINSTGKKNINDALQIGAYFIIIGLISSLVFLLIAFFMRDTDHSNSNTKKCPFCANEIKWEAIVCQFCGRDLPKLLQNNNENETVGK